jgi:hypothetical protein
VAAALEEQIALFSEELSRRYTRRNTFVRVVGVAEELKTIREGESKAAATIWIAAVWVSFLVWLFHSFAVHEFIGSLHVLSRLAGPK